MVHFKLKRVIGNWCADPAAESFAYAVSVDVRELVTLEDVMEEMELGPNGCGPLASSRFSGCPIDIEQSCTHIIFFGKKGGQYLWMQ